MRTRQSNLELLRIIGILMIVMMHFTSQAGIPTSGNIFAILLSSGGRIAVNIFLLIGCWFMVDAPFRPARIVKLYLQVVFYSIPITLLMLAMGEDGGFRNLFQGPAGFRSADLSAIGRRTSKAHRHLPSPSSPSPSS